MWKKVCLQQLRAVVKNKIIIGTITAKLGSKGSILTKVQKRGLQKS